ncbi:MAG: molybdopterin-synthase adenylyltransferase MoeB [Gammaproteobacteria bacterium]|nr:molybdopterin-synthase adenylyltransferase MoeB [Gammaproteobacteria bacterium]MCY4210490.1 molybdopterin-synthase adenylyltransferase MoeB [Gammaproteobacteria bacterium]MCY4281716.1 molybdopterin-synthase adenylyltransferase MoeB [Gammaproteobacteria bacterium]MCY4337899.1 molybdopterin-synthase adenylyltransferase MoeB [Gammaproteobacteria bacterium]
MNDEQLLRYSRQLMLPEIDAAGQLRLAQATVLLVGAGGLGSACAIYLAAGGVGHLILTDFDHVDLSNLQRQILYDTADIGRPKVEAAAARLRALNPDVKLTLLAQALTEDELTKYSEQADVIIDGSDNFTTRFAVNRVSVATRTPLVSAAAIRFEAQLSVFNPQDETSPCYRCLYQEDSEVEATCTANGVLAPLLGIAGSIQATEAMKLIMGLGNTLQGRLLLLDVMAMEWHSAVLPKDPGCPVCGGAK